LNKGYEIKTALRSLNQKNEVIEMLKSGRISSFEKPAFIEADLTKDAKLLLKVC